MSLSQKQLRYLNVNTVEELRSHVNALPSDLSLVLENGILYQYREFVDGSAIPSDDGVKVIQTNDETLNTRWIAIDAYSTKSIIGTITNDMWVLDQENSIYKLNISLVNPVNTFNIKFVNNENKQVFPQDIIYTKTDSKITNIQVNVASIPDCRFTGEYTIFIDILV